MASTSGPERSGAKPIGFSSETSGREPGRLHHDMGGLPAGPVAASEHDYAPWEKRVDALMVLLSSPRHDLLKVDELRRHIEGLGAEAYERMSYYERWMAAIAGVMIERGVIAIDELGRRMAAVETRERDAAAAPPGGDA